MKKTKKTLSILLSCVMLLSLLSVGVFAEDYIDANAKWFGYGVDCYLLNPSMTEGDTDGLWYQLNVEQDGLLFLEHNYKNVDYTVTMTVNGTTYEAGAVDGVLYNAPIASLPVKTGDVAIVNIVTKDAAAGTVYANMKIVAGTADDPIKVKSSGITVSVAAGQTVYYQDDSLNAIYATSGALISGNVANATFYTVTRNAESGAVSQKAHTDTDADGIIETKLGGSLGSAGAPPVKPCWAIENNSAEDQVYTITLVADAHECVYDDDADKDCNTCGAVRELAHEHVYDHDYDKSCNTCGDQRETELPLESTGNSISTDVNGLAFLVEAKVDGIQLSGTTANYANATVGRYKLIKMGAVISNNAANLGYVPDLDDVDGVRAVNAEAKYICAVNEAAGTVSYAVRAINIPDEYKDREISILPYVIFQDEAGVEHTLYCNSASAAYNWFA
ncbi:MAG: hypothetical protein E7527_03195 [Ruminococcaceae bacterium]|nr:hypothetical protein [Oscillospiraceae bacterium]